MKRLLGALPGAILLLFVTASVLHAQEPESVAQESELAVEGPEPLVSRFDIPLYKGYRLDWCLIWADHFGTDAAHVYCLSRGYSTVYSFAAAWDVGPTMLIGTDQFCNASWCDSFLYIICQ